MAGAVAPLRIVSIAESGPGSLTHTGRSRELGTPVMLFEAGPRILSTGGRGHLASDGRMLPGRRHGRARTFRPCPPVRQDPRRRMPRRRRHSPAGSCSCHKPCRTATSRPPTPCRISEYVMRIDARHRCVASPIVRAAVGGGSGAHGPRQAGAVLTWSERARSVGAGPGRARAPTEEETTGGMTGEEDGRLRRPAAQGGGAPSPTAPPWAARTGRAPSRRWPAPPRPGGAARRARRRRRSARA